MKLTYDPLYALSPWTYAGTLFLLLQTTKSTKKVSWVKLGREDDDENRFT